MWINVLIQGLLNGFSLRKKYKFFTITRIKFAFLYIVVVKNLIFLRFLNLFNAH